LCFKSHGDTIKIGYAVSLREFLASTQYSLALLKTGLKTLRIPKETSDFTVFRIDVLTAFDHKHGGFGKLP
jgi:hypothetical protein